MAHKNERSRTRNWTDDQTFDLLALVISNYNVLRGKYVGTNCGEMRRQKWEEVANIVSASHPGLNVNGKQCKKRFNNVYTNVRKRDQDVHIELNKEGGGTPQNIVYTPAERHLSDWLGENNTEKTSAVSGVVHSGSFAMPLFASTPSDFNAQNQPEAACSSDTPSAATAPSTSASNTAVPSTSASNTVTTSNASHGEDHTYGQLRTRANKALEQYALVEEIDIGRRLKRKIDLQCELLELEIQLAKRKLGVPLNRPRDDDDMDFSKLMR